MEAREWERAKEMERGLGSPFLLLVLVPSPPLSESLEQATVGSHCKPRESMPNVRLLCLFMEANRSQSPC